MFCDAEDDVKHHRQLNPTERKAAHQLYIAYDVTCVRQSFRMFLCIAQLAERQRQLEAAPCWHSVRPHPCLVPCRHILCCISFIHSFIFRRSSRIFSGKESERNRKMAILQINHGCDGLLSKVQSNVQMFST